MNILKQRKLESGEYQFKVINTIITSIININLLLILSNINRGYFREQNKNQVNTKSGYLLFLYSNI